MRYTNSSITHMSFGDSVTLPASLTTREWNPPRLDTRLVRSTILWLLIKIQLCLSRRNDGVCSVLKKGVLS